MTLRGALLGAGNIAQLGHIPAYRLLGEVRTDFQLVAVADLCAENLEQVVALLPGIRAFGDAGDLLAAIRPDFVDICAPPHTHRQLIEQAIDAGCHILCEKPLSLTLSDAEALATSLRGQPFVFMPGHQYHYSPAWQAITQAIRSGEIGEPRFGAVAIERQRANPGNRYWNPAWRTTEDLSGGGILMDHGTHLFYQLRDLFGEPQRIGACAETRRHTTYGVEDTMTCYVEFAKSLVRIHLTWAGNQRRTTHWYAGDAGQLRAEESAIRISGLYGSRSVDCGAGFSADSSHADWYVPLLADFLDRIDRRDYDNSALDEAVSTIRCTTAAYASARTGSTIDLH